MSVKMKSKISGRSVRVLYSGDGLDPVCTSFLLPKRLDHNNYYINYLSDQHMTAQYRFEAR